MDDIVPYQFFISLPMKKAIALGLFLMSAGTLASASTLLEQALACQLKDSQLPTLMRDLAAQQPAFAKPAAQYGAPSADVYQLAAPVKAFGYASAEIVITSGRILLAVPGESLPKAIGKLKLTEEPYSPASRPVRPTVSVVALEMTHKTLENKLLVGCQYANNDAARWILP